MMKKWIVRGPLLAVCCLIAFAAHADTRHVIICGSGGEPEYVAKFRDWGLRLYTVLAGYAGNNPDHAVLFTENGPSDLPLELAGAQQSNLENIRAVFAQLEAAMSPEDDVIVYLIGHGSFRRDEAKFMIPGPDLSAGELREFLDRLDARRAAVVNGSSSSAGFINVLGSAGHVVCTATKSADERNATEFMRFFVESLEDGSADQDHDGRVSIFEVCNQAAARTAAWYKNEGLIQTEHALLEDNGDGLGTRLPLEGQQDDDETVDGARAKNIFVKDFVFSPSIPPELIKDYRDALHAVEELKRAKSSLPESDYYAELEALLLQAARANREIRDRTDDEE
jgi:hypothetical protein